MFTAIVRLQNDLADGRSVYVYASRDFEVVHAQVPDLGCSDHHPVIVDLVLPERSQSSTSSR